MDRVLAIVWRLLVCTFAYGAAAISAGVMIGWVVGSSWFAGAADGPAIAEVERGVTILAGFFAAILVVTLAFVPAAIVIALTEVFKLRALTLYLVAGPVAALAAYLGTAGPVPTTREATILAAGGVIGGLVYWAIAGRKAGTAFDLIRAREAADTGKTP